MYLRSATSYWTLQTPLLHTYNALDSDCNCDVAVIGGGISGALAAYALVNAGCKVMLVTKGHVAMGSTAASTSLLQYEIDTPLYKLIEKVGRQKAEAAYLLCHQSVDELEKIHRHIGMSKIFERRKSLQLASTKKDIPALELEFLLRQNLGIELELLSPADVKHRFGFTAPGALYSVQAAQTNSYLFTQELIHWCHKHGAAVHDKTVIKNIQQHKNGVHLLTGAGHIIKAKHAVMATGYAVKKWLNLNVERLHTTFVIISEPLSIPRAWQGQCLIWETAHPYTYMRTVGNRIMAGGKDEMKPNIKNYNTAMHAKSKQLLHAFNRKFPQTQFNIEQAWSGIFAETADGLPFIGKAPGIPKVFFVLGFGGNGITFSQIAADIITNTITGKPNPHKNLFGFERKNAKSR